MIEALVDASLRHRVRVLVATAVAAVLALWLGRTLRFDALPDVTGQQVLVLTAAPGYVPEEVERLVTRPIELVLGGLPHATNQRSVSRAGISSVTVLFDDEIPILQARQLVQERLSSLGDTLPDGVDSPELGPLSGGLGEIYQFTVESSDRTTTELSELVAYRIAPLLRSVPGVVELNTWGSRTRTMDVAMDPLRMAQRAVTQAELEEALRRATGHAAGFVLEKGGQGSLLRGVAWPERHGQLAAAVIRRQPDGRVLTVGDVAEVREGIRPRLGTATANGRGETLFVMVQMHLDDNALQVLDRVHDKMSEVHAVLPPDVHLSVVYDRGDLVFATLRTVAKNLLEGAALVVCILFALLGSWRAGAIVAAVIPLSLLGAVAGMALLGIPGNLMSLGALDFGLLVDGGVVMAEAVFVALAAGRTALASVEGSRASAAEPQASMVRAMRSMARPVFYSVVMILLVYLPILGLEGVEGKMFRPMAGTVVLALATALVLSLTFVPAALAAFVDEDSVPRREPWLVRQLERAYHPVSSWALDSPRRVAVLAVAGCLLGVWAFSRLGTSFIPQLDEGDLVLQTVRRPDIRLEGAVADELVIETAVRRIPEVRNVVARIGSPAVATDLMGPEQADVFIDLAPHAEWRDGLEREELIAEIQRAVEKDAPPDELGFTQPIQMRFNELVGGSVTDVTLAIFGDDLAQLAQLEARAAELLSRVPGADDVRVMGPPVVPLLEVRPRALEASQVGLTSRDVLDQIVALRAGQVVGTTYDGSVRVPIQLKNGIQQSALTLDALPIPAPGGALVPLGRVAQVTETLTPALIHHERSQRRGLVGFNVRSRDLGSVVRDGQALLARELRLPEGTRLEWGGQFESLQRARARLSILVPLVLVALFSLLLALFRAIRPAALILLNVPFAVVGGTVGLMLTGLPVSIPAAIGFIALSGIAVLNGVVLITALGQELATGVSPRVAAERAVRQRVRPVMMTASVAALGFLPMMFASGVGAEVQRPLAVVVVCGLVTSTVLTLVILPALIPWFYREKRPVEVAAAGAKA
ncbi:MAG TPA: CusA/CzcA family heavy metal efflux RND transporter [Polyangiaceae bacterium]|nr:CusA/CzcA family heavy metal efflux RND transporter [Polyangiaceae bacterium]